MSDLNDVKAGKYQLVTLSWDRITSKPTEPLDFTRYHRGDVVDLSVEDAKRLVAAGAVVKPGELEKLKAEQAKAQALEAQRAYEAALAGLPDDVRAEVTDASGATEDPRPGTVDFILAEVGDDKEKAQVALEAEAASERPRSGLVSKLEKILSAGS